MNLAESFDATRLVKQLVFLIIFIPILITAIDALEMRAIQSHEQTCCVLSSMQFLTLLVQWLF